MKRHLKILLVITVLALNARVNYTQAQATGSVVSSSDKHIYYSGRIDFQSPEMPRLYWSSSIIRARFTGSSIKAILNDSSGKSTYHVVIDKNEANAFTLSCLEGTHIYDLASDLEGDDHEILIAKRTEYNVGNTGFGGFILDTGKKLSKYPLYHPRRRIEFYGDSITCGMGNEDESLVNNSDMNLENGYMTYAAMTARNLNAEAHVISRSGIGFMVSWDDVIMPDIYDRLNPQDPQSKWDFNKWTPDVVVVNLGTNDSWLCDNRFKTKPTKMQIIEAYISFIRMIRAKYPNTYIICTLGNMNSTAEGEPFPDYIQKAVGVMKKRYQDNKLDTQFFPFKGSDGHPTISEQKMMAKPLTQKISNITGWGVETMPKTNNKTIIKTEEVK